MVVSIRTIVAAGLGFLGLAVLVGPTLGQQPQDPALRKATTQAAASAPQPPTPVTVGCVDISAIFKGYDKVKANSEEFRAAVMAKKNELMKFMAEAQQESETIAKLTPGSVDFKKHEDRITELKAKHEAGREQYEREFTLREAEMLATLYKEVQAMVGRIAKFRGFVYVVRVSNDPITGANPNSAMAAIERTVVYADPRNDITNDVIYNLNREYKASGGTVPKGPATGAAGAPGGAAPAGAVGSPAGN
jgi:Skp family chaperone for outer membrane proteins